jgi:hypothetical protein
MTRSDVIRWNDQLRQQALESFCRLDGLVLRETDPDKWNQTVLAEALDIARRFKAARDGHRDEYVQVLVDAYQLAYRARAWRAPKEYFFWLLSAWLHVEAHVGPDAVLNQEGYLRPHLPAGDGQGVVKVARRLAAEAGDTQPQPPRKEPDPMTMTAATDRTEQPQDDPDVAIPRRAGRRADQGARTTPFAFVRAECPNLWADGRCLRLMERPELHDFALPLPKWLSPERWAELVQAAREAGETMICVRVWQTAEGVTITPQTAEDRRRALALAVGQRIELGRRYDLYFCPGCGARIGCRGKLPEKLPAGLALGTMCRACSPVKRAHASADCLVHRGARCRYFERRILPLADHGDPRDEPGLQARRLAARRAYLEGLAPKETPQTTADPSRICPDCGGPLAKHRRVCAVCAAKRRRSTKRRNQRRRRSRCRTDVAEKAAVSA